MSVCVRPVRRSLLQAAAACAAAIVCLTAVAQTPLQEPPARYRLERDPARYTGVPPERALHVLSYHEVYASEAEREAARDPLGVTVQELARQFSLLRDLGYPVVSAQALIDAIEGRATLPPNAVLLVFDDGYRSFHRHVLPLLRAFGYPAVAAIVTSWTQAGRPVTADGTSDRSGSLETSRLAFMSWAELRDAVASGWVEVASHTHALHKKHAVSSFGDLAPQAATRAYESRAQRAETAAEWRRRVEADLRESRRLIEEQLGTPARLVVWPYGAAPPWVEELLAEGGFALSFGLDGHANDWQSGSRLLSRHLVTASTDASTLELKLRPREVPTRRTLAVALASAEVAQALVEPPRFDRWLDTVQAFAPSHVRFMLGPAWGELQSGMARDQAVDRLTRLVHRTRVAAGVRVEVDASALTASVENLVGASVVEELLERTTVDSLVLSLEHPRLEVKVAALRARQPRVEALVALKLPEASCAFAHEELAASAFAQSWRRALAVADYAVLTLPAALWRQCATRLETWLTEIARALPDRAQRTEITVAVPAVSPNAQQAHALTESQLSAVLEPLERLLASGFRHLGLAPWREDVAAEVQRPLKRLLSLRTLPIRP
ncbi:MAG: polysaccharide deacetylase family protein [Casimicrobiaceae bacterium]|nr:polysaccharide deacetylase family protein [Casimicrobiaceae bacterium]